MYDIDEEALERKFKALQWQLHPDRYTTANAVEQSHSTDQAALVNEAYKVLKDPLLRAEYMVRIFWCAKYHSVFNITNGTYFFTFTSIFGTFLCAAIQNLWRGSIRAGGGARLCSAGGDDGTDGRYTFDGRAE